MAGDYGVDFSLLGADERPDFGSYKEGLPTLQGIPQGAGTPTASPMGGSPMGPLDPRDVEALDAIRKQRQEMEGLGFWGRTLRGIPADRAARDIGSLAQSEINARALANQKQMNERQVGLAEQLQKLKLVDHMIAQAGALADLEPEERASQISFLKPVYESVAKAHGVDIPENFLAAAATRKGVADQLRELLHDLPDDRREAVVKLGRKVKPDALPKFLESQRQAYEDELKAEYYPRVGELANQIRRKKGLPMDAELEPRDMMEEVSTLPMFRENGTFRRVATELFTQKGDENILASANILTPKAIIQRQMNKGKSANRQNMLKSLASEIIKDPEFGASGYTIDTMEEMPADQLGKFAVRAQERIDKRTLEERSKLAYATADANKQANQQFAREQPYGESEFHIKGGRYRDRETGAEAPLDMTMEQIRTNKKYINMTEGEEKAYRSILESRALVLPYMEIANKLTPKPGQNFKQALDEYVKGRLGKQSLETEFEALSGSVLRLAGAMQGSRAQLSDNDRKSVEKMVPGIFDTQQSAHQRIGVLNRILSTMEDAALGRIDKKTLDDRAAALLREVKTPVTIKGITVRP